MLSRDQFAKATSFLGQYQDALRTVEQIAEKRQAYDHYESTTGQLVSGLQNNQVNLSNGSAVGAANKADFVFVRAHQHAKDVFAQYKLDKAGSRDEFVKNLNTAISGLSE